MKTETKRRRQWATPPWFSKLRRKRPKTWKTHELHCPYCQKRHLLTIHATWIWEKVERRKTGYGKLLTETMKRYSPWLTNNFFSPSAIWRFMHPTLQTWVEADDEHLSKLAVHYGFLG